MISAKKFRDLAQICRQRADEADRQEDRAALLNVANKLEQRAAERDERPAIYPS